MHLVYAYLVHTKVLCIHKSIRIFNGRDGSEGKKAKGTKKCIIKRELMFENYRESLNHDKILMLAKSKFNSIDTLISQALIDMDISHEEFITILKEKDRYEMMKENLKNKNGESYEIIRFNSVKSNT